MEVKIPFFNAKWNLHFHFVLKNDIYIIFVILQRSIIQLLMLAIKLSFVSDHQST